MTANKDACPLFENEAKITQTWVLSSSIGDVTGSPNLCNSDQEVEPQYGVHTHTPS